jgi:hypothetical protein
MKIKPRFSLISIPLFAFVFSASAYSQQATNLGCAITWETSFEAAKTRAQKEGKPIIALQLFGRLDDEMA